MATAVSMTTQSCEAQPVRSVPPPHPHPQMPGLREPQHPWARSLTLCEHSVSSGGRERVRGREKRSVGYEGTFFVWFMHHKEHVMA